MIRMFAPRHPMRGRDGAAKEERFAVGQQALSPPRLELPPPGKVPCPMCQGEKSVEPQSIGGPEPLPCPMCNGQGCVEFGPLMFGYRAVGSQGEGWPQEITLGSLLTSLLLALRRSLDQLANVGRK